MAGYSESENRMLDKIRGFDKSGDPRAKFKILGRKEKNARLD